LLFVVDVNLGKTFSCVGECPEVGGEGNAGEFAFKVGSVAITIMLMMQDTIDVVEDVPFCDRPLGASFANRLVLVVAAKLL
jgi:hypothetical protein